MFNLNCLLKCATCTLYTSSDISHCTPRRPRALNYLVTVALVAHCLRERDCLRWLSCWLHLSFIRRPRSDLGDN